jgi:NTP pyrophosphatase (non-canonical NTP hydrolase)
MKCKITGLECVENKNGWCKVYNCQLKDVTEKQKNICQIHATNGERTPYITSNDGIIIDDLPEELDPFSVKSTYKKAIEKFGIDSQIDKLIEEMSELTQALCKFKRGKPHNVEEEIADVEIVLNQIRTIFDIQKIDVQYSIKLKKLEHHLSGSDDDE